MTLLDITQRLRPALPGWPGEPGFAIDGCAAIGPDCPVNTARLTLSTHAGTHADAPLHYDPAGQDSATCDLTPYIGACAVVDARGCGPVLSASVIDWPAIAGATRVLFRTYDAFPHDRWDSAFTAIAAEVIDQLGAQGVVLVGTDAASLDPEQSKTLDAHHAVRRHGMAILEGLVLDQVTPGAYELIALPLPIEGGDSSPVRAILRTLP
ncbi:arylformamidase [Novosphingobium lentum]|uniref:arylformamidase n=1 Tax=Novosphingobium lentum TaxID=145287 RepID=UPI00082B3979|nr:arylformamidase [Novosphingobium lentum]